MKPKPPVNEAWLEHRFERYEAFAINKRKSGVRLCVRFEDPDNVFARTYAVVQPVNSDVFEKFNGKISRKSIVVFEFLAPNADEDNFPSNGTFIIGKRELVKDPVEVYATYDFLPYESGSVKKVRNEEAK